MCFLIGVCLYLSSYRAITDSDTSKVSTTETSNILTKAIPKSALAATPKSALAATPKSALAATPKSALGTTSSPKTTADTRNYLLTPLKSKSASAATRTYKKPARRYYKSRKSASAATSGKSASAATSGKSASAATRKSASAATRKSASAATRKSASAATRKSASAATRKYRKLENKKRVVKIGNTYVPIHINPEKDPKMNIIQLSEVVVPVSMVNLVNDE